MTVQNQLRHFDFPAFATALALSGFGLLGIYSSGIQGASGDLFLRQSAWILISVLICFLFLSLDYHLFVTHAFLLYGACLVLLTVTLFFGTEVHGSKSWIKLGPAGFQPSELGKIVLVLAIARYLEEFPGAHLRIGNLLVLTALTAIPAGLVIAQGDLGTALMYFPILMGMALVAGMRARSLLAILLMIVILAPLGWVFLADYQKQRIRVTLDPSLDPQGVGYQTRQAEIAIGSGGLAGNGFGRGLQSQLGFVPEIQTDFVFALVGEELGFLGAAFVLLLYLLLSLRLISIAEGARDRSGILVATAVSIMLFSHVVINVGMVVGLLPPIGIPLVLLSYGGSSTLTTFAAIGIVLGIHKRRFVY